MRPIMAAQELADHKIDRHGRDYRFSDDGWSDMDVASRVGWSAVSGWGSSGWDLGDWPYVVISVRDVNGKYQMRQTVEGDTDAYEFDTIEDRSAAIDYLFIWYGVSRDYDEWVANGLTDDKREALDAGTLRVPEQFRGPFSWRRLDAEQTARNGMCEVCQTPINDAENDRLNADMDFVQHYGTSATMHTIRRVRSEATS